MSLAKMAFQALGKVFKPEIIKVSLAATWRCNHRCASCGIWQEENTSDELTLDEIGKIINNNNLLWFSITGGEAFLRADIAEILKMALLKYPSVSIASNGSLPDKIEKAISYALSGTKGLLAVTLSLDGNKEQHDKFTGREGSFERVTETLDRLIALNDSRLRITIENLVSGTTHDGFDFVKRYVELKNVSLAYTVEMRSNAYYRNGDIPINRNTLPDVTFDLKNPFNYLYIRQAKRAKPVRCVAGEYDCVITPEGGVKPCWFLEEESYNIRGTDYKIIPLHCENTVEICNEMGGCWTPCESYITMMMRPWRVL